MWGLFNNNKLKHCIIAHNFPCAYGYSTPQVPQNLLIVICFWKKRATVPIKHKVCNDRAPGKCQRFEKRAISSRIQDDNNKQFVIDRLFNLQFINIIFYLTANPTNLNQTYVVDTHEEETAEEPMETSNLPIGSIIYSRSSFEKLLSRLGDFP